MVATASVERLADAAPGTFFLRLERVFAAPPERVFAAFTEQKQLLQWWGPKGMGCPHVEIEARAGGHYRTCMRRPDGGEFWVSGIYREVDPPRRLVFTWAWETDGTRGQETLVTLTFSAVDQGTRLVLVQTGFADEETRGKHEHGWGSTFDSLEDFLSEGAKP